MTIAADPWAVTDHDPTSNLNTAGPSTAAVLAYARADIHSAVAAADDPHRRHQYALSARDNAVTVLLARLVNDVRDPIAQAGLIWPDLARATRRHGGGRQLRVAGSHEAHTLLLVYHGLHQPTFGFSSRPALHRRQRAHSGLP